MQHCKNMQQRYSDDSGSARIGYTLMSLIIDVSSVLSGPLSISHELIHDYQLPLLSTMRRWCGHHLGGVLGQK